MPNRRRFLAATAGVCLGTGVASTSSDRVAGADTSDHLLQIKGSGSHATYSFTVSNNLEKSTAGGGTISGEDHVFNQNRSASGAVGGGTDAYTFDGDLVAFDLDGEVNVLLDGQPAHVGHRPDHFLQIQGQGSYTTYSFTVGDNLRKSTAGGGTINREDHITNQNRSASGAVGGGTDAYTFDGDLRAFDFDGEVNVLLDGQPAHVGQLPDSVGSSPPKVIWNRTYDNSTDGGIANSVVPTSDGGYAFAGQTDNEGWLVKTDAAGERQWGKPISSVDTVSSLVQTHDGGFALAGARYSRYHSPEIYGRLIKTDADGKELWRRRFHNRVPSELLQTHDGEYILAGEKQRYGDNRSSGGWAARTNSGGDTEWSQTFGNESGDTFASVVRTRDGGYIFAGDKGKGQYSSSGWAVRTTPAGHRQWSRTYDRDTFGTFTSVQRASTGGYVLAGYKDKPAWAVRINELGDAQWNRTYGNTSKYVYHRFETLIPVSDGGHVLAGEIFYPDSDDVSGWVEKIDAAGNRVWSIPYLAPKNYPNGYLYDIIRAHDGGYVVAGTAATEADSGGDGGWMVKLA